jgi:hypothetical protein
MTTQISIFEVNNMPRIRVELDMADFISDIVVDMPREELIDMIKQIDREVAEFEFTEELRDYFTKEMDSEEEFYEDEDL